MINHIAEMIALGGDVHGSDSKYNITTFSTWLVGKSKYNSLAIEAVKASVRGRKSEHMNRNLDEALYEYSELIVDDVRPQMQASFNKWLINFNNTESYRND